MTLGEFTEIMPGNNYLIIKKGNEQIYKGFAGCLKYKDNIDYSAKVIWHTISVEMEKRQGKWDRSEPEQVEYSPEMISEFKFSDLYVKVYIYAEIS